MRGSDERRTPEEIVRDEKKAGEGKRRSRFFNLCRLVKFYEIQRREIVEIHGCAFPEIRRSGRLASGLPDQFRRTY